MFISCVNDVWHFYCVEEFVRNCRHVVDTELYRAIASLGVEPVSPGGTFQVGCLRLICKDFTKADMKIGSVEICWNLLKLNFAASNCFNLRLCLSLLIPLLLRKKEAKTFLRNEHSPMAQIEDTSWTWRPDLTTWPMSPLPKWTEVELEALGFALPNLCCNKRLHLANWWQNMAHSTQKNFRLKRARV